MLGYGILSLHHPYVWCFTGDGWTSACQWEVVYKFLILLCLCEWLWLCLLNSLYLNLQVFSLLPLSFPPPSYLEVRGKEWCRESEQASSCLGLSCQLGLIVFTVPLNQFWEADAGFHLCCGMKFYLNVSGISLLLLIILSSMLLPLCHLILPSHPQPNSPSAPIFFLCGLVMLAWGLQEKN